MKTCIYCKERKPLSEFASDRSRKDGKSNCCKECRKQYDAQPKKRYNNYREGARRRNLEFEITKKEFMEFWNKECVYCGDLIGGIGIDRIDSSKGYIKGNVVPCCGVCNRFKWGMGKDEFIQHCKKVSEHNSGPTP